MGKQVCFLPHSVLCTTEMLQLTKQHAFNKSMIIPFTEEIFIDEATESMLNMEDWKTTLHRQISHLLQNGKQIEKENKERQEWNYQQRQESLMERGASEEHAALLPTDSTDPLPLPIRYLQAAREQALQREISAKRRAREAFKELWLEATERELDKCNITLTSVVDRQRRTLMESYLEVLQDKLKNHHCNLGTLMCENALEERRRWCCAKGLLMLSKVVKYTIKKIWET